MNKPVDLGYTLVHRPQVPKNNRKNNRMLELRVNITATQTEVAAVCLGAVGLSGRNRFIGLAIETLNLSLY